MGALVDTERVEQHLQYETMVHWADVETSQANVDVTDARLLLGFETITLCTSGSQLVGRDPKVGRRPAFSGSWAFAWGKKC